MTTKTVQIKKTNNLTEEIKKKYLSIQFSLDGFSFCIKDEHDEIICLRKHPFEKRLISPESLLNEIESTFKTEKELQDEFEEIFVIHESSLNTIVPNEYFDEKELISYLDFNIKTLSSDYITFDNLEEISDKNIYVPYVNINNYLFQNFGSFTYTQHKSILIDKLFVLNAESNDIIYANIGARTFDLIYFNNDILTFCNSFDYHTIDDFMYFLLFSLEQLKLDTNTVKLHLLGDIQKNSELYETILKYIKLVFLLSEEHNAHDKYTNFILLG